jgi:hypothetical protein
MRLHKRLCLALVLSWAALAAAGEPARCGPPGGPDWQVGHGVTLLPSAGYSGTAGPFASATLIIGETAPKCAKCALAAGSRGVLVQLSPGLYAGRGSVGLAAFNTALGMAAKATIERTWRDKGSVTSGVTFLGPEVEAQIGAVRLTTGVLWRVAGRSSSGARWSWEASYGF